MNYKLEELLACWKEINYTKNFSLPKFNLPSVSITLPSISVMKKSLIGLTVLGVVAGGSVGIYKGVSCIGGEIVNQIKGDSLEDLLPKKFVGLKWGMNIQEVRRFQSPGNEFRYDSGMLMEAYSPGKNKELDEFLGYPQTGGIIGYGFPGGELGRVLFIFKNNNSQLYEKLVEKYENRFGAPQDQGIVQLKNGERKMWERDELTIYLDNKKSGEINLWFERK